MLKFRLNRKQILGGLQPLNVVDHELKGITVMDGEKEQNLLVCYCDTLDGVSVGSSLMCLSEIEQFVEGMLTSKVYNFTQFHTISAIDDTQRSFSTILDKYLNLPIKRIYVTNDDRGEVAHILFENSHFFSHIVPDQFEEHVDADEETEKPILHFTYTGEDDYTLEYDIHIDGEKVSIGTYNIIDVVVDEGGVNGDEHFADLIGYIRKYIQRPDDDISQLFQSGVSTYVGEVSPSIFSIGREQPMFDKTAGFRYYVEKTTQRLAVNLDSNNQFGLTRDLTIQGIASDYKQKVVNEITDVERDVYHPVYKNNKGKFLPIYQIKFNLHFRQHRGDDWLVDSDTFWNGVAVKGDKAELMKEIETKDDDKVNFFSTGEGCEGYQSDLLTYLNFTNSDVKFQKSRLKKSFLRLGFYDSDDVNEQSMLASSTIFMNAGNVFTKQVRHLTTRGYISLDKDDDDVRTNLTGSKVDREVVKGSLSNAEVEDRRLSCQFVVEDRDNSMSSSEGFYLYLMKTMRTGTAPENIYMRVEFNHAGYGITSPMMMPYVDPKKHNGNKGIKSFENILKDWNREGIDGPYGIRQYLKFIHLKFKYCYDDTSKRYVYYLDDETYGNGDDGKEYRTYDENSGVLTINLYEAKIDTRTDVPEDDKKSKEANK